MAGAVTHTWPEQLRHVLVGTVLDGDHHGDTHNVASALKAAKNGRLRIPEQPAWPSESTVYEWVRKERAKRARQGHVEPGETSPDVAERLRLRALKIADMELATLERRATNERSPRRDMDRLEKVLAVVNRASPPTARKPPAEKGAAQNGNRNGKADGDGTAASDLAERLAARANKTTKAQPPTQRETPPAQQQDHEPDHEDTTSDPVERAHDGVPAVAA